MSATIRHTQDKVVWRKGTRDLTTYALNEDGARYIIHCLGRQWLIMFLRFGRADKGHERVPWLEGRRTLALAKQSVEAHNQARCLAGPPAAAPGEKLDRAKADRLAQAVSMGTSPVNCFADLYEWVIRGSWQEEIDTGDMITHAEPPTGTGARCAVEARDHRHHTCWCGRFNKITAQIPQTSCGTCHSPIAGLQTDARIGKDQPRQWVDARNNVAATQPIWHAHSPTPQCAHCPHPAETGHHTQAGYCTAYGCNCRQHPTPINGH
ncbi:hypothetical protein [Mycobacteroides abscessus]|uniref:hypothetical protein n=1 Tax=Mycobacteroides abscessus TaxID=36809 RepID=UPI0009A5BA46|nr:hypothetical protein [Mycobacteroides abscessus]RIS77915.1 hypothetical protein D2E54_15285 [Mycobacteroides abscessus]SKQ73391.1 Uncharacterised protein [Mycobacteroides abscessus subsp. massiliense]